MGERADELTPRGSYDAPDPDNYAILPVDQRGGSGSDESPEVIRADIEQTRAEMSDTINAIQQKLDPQQILEQAKTTAVEAATTVIDHAKESIAETLDHAKDSVKEAATDVVDHTKQSVHDATIGKVENMVSNVSETAQETGSGIIEMVKRNPIPAALVGLGLGWLFMRGQNKPASSSASHYSPTYGYPNQPSNQYPTRTGYNNNYGYTPSGSSQSSNEGLAERVVGAIRQNPIPAAVAGISLGYLVTQGQSSGKQSGQSGNYSGYGQYNQYNQQNLGQKVGNVAGQVGDKVGDITDQAGQKVGDIADQAGNIVGQAGQKVGDIASGVGEGALNVVAGVGSTVSDVAGGVGDTVSNIAGGVGDTVSGVASGVQYQAQRAQTQFGRMLEEKPLAVGVIAMAVGVTVGLMLPNTEPENQILGEARDNVLGKAQEAVQDTLGKVGNVAQSVTQEVEHTIRREAENQGLLGDSGESENTGGSSSNQGNNRPTGQQGQGSTSRSAQNQGPQRPTVMNNLSSTQMEELQRQLRENDRQGFLNLTNSYGWDKPTGEEVWNYMNRRPTQDEVMRAFGGQNDQSGSQARP